MFRKQMTVTTIILVAATLTAAAAAGTGWTARATETLLVSRATTFYTVNGGPGNARTAHCRGIGRPASGTYAGFSCALTWISPNDPTVTGHATMFVRPWSKRAVCISEASLGTCPPPAPASPAPRDPRACGLPNQALCVSRAVTAAMVAAVNTAGVGDAAARTVAVCRAGAAWTSYSCNWHRGIPAGTGTVSIAHASAGWTVVANVS